MDILEELKQLTETFEENRIPYALCGGLAMAVYARPRATLDIDLMIEKDDLEAATTAAERLGFELSAAPMTFQGGKIRIHRLAKADSKSGETLVLDLLTVTPQTRNVWETRQKVEWAGGALRVLSPKGLIQLKSLRGSGQDQDDIDYLEKILDED